jgi:DNA-binding NtrC family response regulator
LGTLSTTQKDDLSPSGPSDRVEPSLHVVIEGERLLAGGMRVSLDGVKEVRFARGQARTWKIDGGTATLEVPDPRMSGRHGRLVKENAGWFIEDLGSTNGTFVEGMRLERTQITKQTVVTLGATCLLVDPAEPAADKFPALVDAPSLKSRPRGTSTLVPIVDAQMPRLVRVAMSKLSVLLLGESGVGKEVLARTVHTLSARQGPFVAINCGGLSANLVESQLFGHVKGAFSGAMRDELGLVRTSSGGTLFLDEIGELPASAQATLLRVLQEREVLPVGAAKPVQVDLRVVAATLKPIDESSTFRQDLYARVAAFVHRLTSLRQRRADIGLLVADLLPRIAADRAEKVRFAPDLVTALVSHPWPMNVRQLEHALSVALVTQGGELIKLEDVGEALKLPRTSDAPKRAGDSNVPREPDDDDGDDEISARPSRELTDAEVKLKGELVDALTRTKGNISEIAREMGKTRMQIHRWMKRFGIVPESFRG